MMCSLRPIKNDSAGVILREIPTVCAILLISGLVLGCDSESAKKSNARPLDRSKSGVELLDQDGESDQTDLIEMPFRGLEAKPDFPPRIGPSIPHAKLFPNAQLDHGPSLEQVLAKIKKEDFKSAEADLRSLAWKSPNDPTLSYLLALCLYRQDKFVTAKVHIDTAVKNADPANGEYEYLGGLIYFALREYETAIDRFTAAEQLEVSSETLYRLRAASLLNHRQYDAAVADATKALAEDSDNPESYYIRSCAHAMLDKKAAAQADFESAKILGLDAKRTEDLEKLLAR